MNRLQALRAKTWPIVYAVLLTFFGLTRLYNLGARPLHHDEGVNGNFMKILISSGQWHYDPKNYHGPTLFFFQVVPTWIASYINDGLGAFNKHSISGITPVGMRLPIAIMGIVLLWMLLESWPMLGKVGAAAACVFAGLSCDILFFSRYFIHEIYVLLFTLAVVMNAYQFHRTRDSLYAYLAALSATLLLCTKETGVFHLIVLVLAYACAQITYWISDEQRGRFSLDLVTSEPAADLRSAAPHLVYIGGLCFLVWMVFFSSFFTNFSGLIDSLRAFKFWGSEGLKSGHVKPFFYYTTDILIRYETVALIFGFVGIAAAFLKNDRTGLFLSFWTMGIVAFYSLVPYKTPWLVVNLVLPLTIVAGYGVQAVAEAVLKNLSPRHAKISLSALAGVGIFLAVAEARQTYRVNFVEYDSDKHPQIYAHTLRDVFNMLAKIDAVSSRAGGKEMTINVFTDVYWPLPMYLNKYEFVRFWGNRVDTCPAPDAPILIVAPQNQKLVDSHLKDLYSIHSYLLRPGVPLELYVNTNVSSTPGVVVSQLDLLTSQSAPKDAAPGLKLEAFAGVNFSGKPTETREGDTSYDFTWLSDPAKKYQSPFSLRWTGYIRVDKAGVYRFGLNSDDGSWLTLDDTPVIDNGGDHALLKMSRSVNLSAGYHRIEVKYYDAGGGAELHFTWAPPGTPEVAVPATVLFHKS